MFKGVSFKQVIVFNKYPLRLLGSYVVGLSVGENEKNLTNKIPV